MDMSMSVACWWPLEQRKVRPGWHSSYPEKEGDRNMAILDWSQCPAVESVPGRLSGAWVFRDTRMPVSSIFENLQYGSSIEEIIDNYHVTREQIQAVLEFVARSLDAPPVEVEAAMMADAHTS
jgi:uncharacterized protein (DUF433 family)